MTEPDYPTRVVADGDTEYVYAFQPEQLVTVTRHDDPPPPVDPQEFAEVRDLAVALAEFAGPATTVDEPGAGQRVIQARERVRTRLEQQETTTDGTDRPDDTGPAPVLGTVTPHPATEPAVDPGPAPTHGTPTPPHPRNPLRDR